MTETKRLGRGLEALLGPISREDAAASGALRELSVAAIGPNPWQPRREFDEAQLGELADSIAASGLLQALARRTHHRRDQQDHHAQDEGTHRTLRRFGREVHQT